MAENVYAPPRANLETQEGPQELWQIEFKQLKRLYYATINIRALGVLCALGSLGLVAAVMFATSSYIASGYGRAMALILFVYGGLSVVGSITSFTRPRWGRIVGIILCVLSLISFPIGTVIGILGTIAYAHGKRLLGPDRLLHRDVVDVYKQRKKAKA
jgi:hypothetical protein